LRQTTVFKTGITVADRKRYLTISLSKKKVKKPLDISPKISDNITNDKVVDIATSDEPEEIEEIEEIEEVEEELTPEEIKEVKKKVQREINTQAIKRDGWLDDVDTNTKK
jgi:hypothetical protein